MLVLANLVNNLSFSFSSFPPLFFSSIFHPYFFLLVCFLFFIFITFWYFTLRVHILNM